VWWEEQGKQKEPSEKERNSPPGVKKRSARDGRLTQGHPCKSDVRQASDSREVKERNFQALRFGQNEKMRKWLGPHALRVCKPGGDEGGRHSKEASP